MIIVKIQGGLGNQMFQYSLYRAFLEKKKDAKMDIRNYNISDFHYGYELNRIFNIRQNLASNKECKKLSGDKYDRLTLFLKRVSKFNVVRQKKTHIIQNSIIEDGNSFSFFKEIFNMDNVYLDGFWQNENYFKDISNIISNDFTFKGPLDNANGMFAELIKSTDSVSIHVRRGDYLQHSHFSEAFDTSYYFKAIQYIESKIQKPTYFVFSDDIEWCIKNLVLENVYYIDFNVGMSSYNDMYLMSICKHNIIANSTFSWWGAWLNQNIKKIVISPIRWAVDYSEIYGSIIPCSWIRI